MIATTQAPLRADQRPLYAQASEALRSLVQRAGYAPGDRLPSEIELSQRLGISRPTLREALRRLEDEGAIIRRHGAGTFVAAPQPVIEAGLEVLESIERLAERCGLRTAMSEAHVAERAAQPAELARLGGAGALQVTVVTRVIMADGERIAHLTDVVPQTYLRQADLQGSPPEGGAGAGFHGSVLDLLRARGWPALAHSRTELSAEAADSELARALRIARGAPLLRLEAQLYAQDGAVVDYSISYFVPGRYRFHVVRRIGA
ncbi:MAG: GntR family transcriptional regulator [Chloroflexota bacterium]|nr:GntR family transcriptional regulator [Chloroflexota bacterium]